MNLQGISRVFRALKKEFDQPCRVILTGAGAGVVYGRIRATMDLDFALKFKTGSLAAKEKLWREFQEAAKKVSAKTGIAFQYAEDIDRWSSITFLDYEKHARPFKKFGRMEVCLLDPSYWAIGKLARYLEPDIRDLVTVLKKTKTSWKKLAPILGLALKKSPKSTACFLFRRQVEDFFTTYGKRIWRKAYSKEKAIQTFHKAAGI